MALFNLLAKSNNKNSLGVINEKIKKFKVEYISVFPIVFDSITSDEYIGMTVSGANQDKLEIIKVELSSILNVLWLNDFAVVELYNNTLIDESNYLNVLAY